MLWSVVRDLTKPEQAYTQAYRKYGDLGSAAYDLLLDVAPKHGCCNVVDVARDFKRIADVRGPAAKASFVRLLMGEAHRARSQVHPQDHHRRSAHRPEGKPCRRGDRQGVRRAASPTVQRANMLLGDIGGTLRLAAEHRLRRRAHAALPSHRLHAGQSGGRLPKRLSTTSSMRRSRTSTTASARRHTVADGEARLFSRTLDEVTQSFPELVPTLLPISPRT